MSKGTHINIKCFYVTMADCSVYSFFQNDLMFTWANIVPYSMTILTHGTWSDKLISNFSEKIARNGAHDI